MPVERPNIELNAGLKDRITRRWSSVFPFTPSPHSIWKWEVVVRCDQDDTGMDPGVAERARRDGFIQCVRPGWWRVTRQFYDYVRYRARRNLEDPDRVGHRIDVPLQSVAFGVPRGFKRASSARYHLVERDSAERDCSVSSARQTRLEDLGVELGGPQIDRAMLTDGVDNHVTVQSNVRDWTGGTGVKTAA